MRKIRGEKQEIKCRVKDKQGKIISEKKEVVNIWKDYFSNLLNVEEERKANVLAIGFDAAGRCKRPQDLQINEGEVRNAIKRLKDGKALGTVLMGC